MNKSPQHIKGCRDLTKAEYKYWDWEATNNRANKKAIRRLQRRIANNQLRNNIVKGATDD